MYGLRGYTGLGVFNPPAIPNYEDCDPRDAACVKRNLDKNSAYQLAMAKAQADNNRDQCLSNANNATSTAQYNDAVARCNAAYSDTAAYVAETSVLPVSWSPPPPPQPPPNLSPSAPSAIAAKGGQFSFTTSRGSKNMQVGDTWMVAITGASPNTQVSWSGSMPGQNVQGAAVGVTDGNGNFSKSGSVSNAEIGNWAENWFVGSQPSGSVSFSVSAAPASGSDVKKQAPPLGGDSGGGAAPPSTGGFDLAGIPWWGWALAAGAAVFAFGGKR